MSSEKGVGSDPLILLAGLCYQEKSTSSIFSCSRCLDAETIGSWSKASQPVLVNCPLGKQLVNWLGVLKGVISFCFSVCVYIYIWQRHCILWYYAANCTVVQLLFIVSWRMVCLKVKKNGDRERMKCSPFVWFSSMTAMHFLSLSCPVLWF